MGEDSWAQQVLASSCLTLLDLTGCVDGDLADEGEQGLGDSDLDALNYGGSCVLAGFLLFLSFCIIAQSLLS